MSTDCLTRGIVSVCFAGILVACGAKQSFPSHETEAPAQNPAVSAGSPDAGPQSTHLTCESAQEAATRVLSADLTLSPERGLSPNARRELLQLNLFLTSSDTSCAHVRENLLTQYNRSLFLNCPENVWEDCPTHAYFAQEGGTSLVVEKLARLVPHPQKMRLLNLGLEISRRARVRSDQLRSLERDYVLELPLYLATVAEPDRVGAIPQTVIARARTLFQTRSELQADPVVLRTLGALGRSMDASGVVPITLQRLAFERGLTEPSLWPELVRSHAEYRKWIRDATTFLEANGASRQALHLRLPAANHIGHLVTHLVFERQLSPLLAERVLARALTSPSASEGWAQDLIDYLRIRFAMRTRDSHRTMAAAFTNPLIGEAELRQQSMSAAEIEAGHWRQFVAQSRDLATAITNRRAQHPSPTLTRALEQIDSLPGDIKIMVVYPQMLMMSYFMSKRNYTEVLRGSIGSFSISADIFVRFILNGSAPPFFDYAIGDTRTPASSFEMPRVIYSAFVTGAFADFGVSPSEFFSEVGRRWINPRMERLNERSRWLQELQAESSEIWEYFRFCRSVQSETPNLNPISLPELRESALLGRWLHLSQSRVRGMSGTNFGGFFSSRPGYFIYTSPLVDMMEHIRIDLMPLRSNLDLIRRGMEALPQVDPQTQEAIQALRNWSDEITTKSQGYLRRFQQLREPYDDCYHTLAEKEKRVQLDIVDYERTTLRTVHADILQIRSGRLTEEAATAKWREVYPGHQTAVRLTRDGFHFSRIDFWLRVRRYLLEGHAGQPALAPYLNIQIPTNLNEHEEYLQPPQFIAFADTPEQFALAGIQNMARGGQNGLKLLWFSDTTFEAVGLRDWVSGLALLYRLQALPTLAGEIRLKDARSLAQQVERVMRLYFLSSREAQFFRSVGSSGRYSYLPHDNSLAGMDDFLTKRGTRTVRGLLDAVVEFVSAPMMGSYGNIKIWEASEGGAPAIMPPELVANTVSAAQVLQLERSLRLGEKGLSLYPVSLQPLEWAMEDRRDTILADRRVMEALMQQLHQLPPRREETAQFDANQSFSVQMFSREQQDAYIGFWNSFDNTTARRFVPQ